MTIHSASMIASELSQRQLEWRRARRSLVAAKWPLLAIIILAHVVIAATFGPWISPMDPNRQNIVMRLADPLVGGPRGLHLLGICRVKSDKSSALAFHLSPVFVSTRLGTMVTA